MYTAESVSKYNTLSWSPSSRVYNFSLSRGVGSEHEVRVGRGIEKLPLGMPPDDDMLPVGVHEVRHLEGIVSHHHNVLGGVGDVRHFRLLRVLTKLPPVIIQHDLAEGTKAFILHDPARRQANAFVMPVVIHVPLLELFGHATGGIPTRLLLQLQSEVNVLCPEASDAVS